MLVLSGEEVGSLLRMSDCVTAMEAVFKGLAKGEYHQPLRVKVLPKDARNRMAMMPAYRGGPNPLWGLKEVVVTPDNARQGLDPHQGAVLLHDGATGALLAVVNAGAITAIRTAAVSAVATAALANPAMRKIAIIGAGHQAHAHITAMRCVAPGCRIELWSRSPDKARSLADETDCHVAPSAEAAVSDADVICTVTSSATPVLKRQWLKAGAHINAVGSSTPTARELDAETIAAGRLFVDRRESAVNEAGDYVIAVQEGAIGPDHIRAELGEVLLGWQAGRTGPAELTIFKSLGLAVQDLAAAELVVKRARESGRGAECAD